MCSQCSFQVILRNLRYKQAKHSHHAAEAGRRALNRRFSASRAPQAGSSTALLPPVKPLSFGIPSFSFLSQSYSIWNTPHSAPLPPPPQEVLQDNPFTSHRDAARLLYSLAKHPGSFKDLKNVVCPSLAGLLSIRHYAGARAVLERTLQEIVNLPSPQLPFGHKPLNSLICTLFGVEEQYRKADWELHSLPAMRSMLFLILKYLTQHFEKFPVIPRHIKTLVCIPEYLSVRAMPLVIALFERVVTEHPEGASLSRNVPTLHNIMRAYALNGHPETARQWSDAILEVLEAYPAERERLKSSTSPLQVLATTYISALARHSEEAGSYDNIDSQTAMEIFQDVWRQTRSDSANAQEPGGYESGEMDIQAWSVMLQATARDIDRISSQKLIDVLHILEENPSLPYPNAVAYTAVLGGINNRGDYAIARSLFENEIIPKAILQVKQFTNRMWNKARLDESVIIDAQLLGTAMHTYAGSGDIETAAKVLEWFGRRELSDNANAESTPSSGSAPGEELPVAEQSSFPEVLKGTVQVDTLVINQLMTYFAKLNRFNSVYNLFDSMTEAYNVYPDDTTLTILSRSALTSAKIKKKGLIPDHAEDLWLPGGLSSKIASGGQESSARGRVDRDAMYGNRQGGQEVRETGVWDGQQPIERVMNMYWSMLEQNFDGAHSIAIQDNLRVESKGFFSFGSKEPEEAVIPAPGMADSPAEEYHFTSGLESTISEEDYTYAWPSLHPTKINMHMLIVLSSYFGRGSDIPLILSHMKALDIRPQHKTLCLALWAYEETGVYTNEMKKFRTWLNDWLGAKNVPHDEEIGASRAKQWGGIRSHVAR